MAKTLLFFTT